MTTTEQKSSVRVQQEGVKSNICITLREFFRTKYCEVLDSHLHLVDREDATYDVAAAYCDELFMSCLAFDVKELLAIPGAPTWNDILYESNRLIANMKPPKEIEGITFKVARSARAEFELRVTIWFARTDYANRPFEELQTKPHLEPFTVGYMRR